jgi:hypothetical protein
MRSIILACRYKLPTGLVSQTTPHELFSIFEKAAARVVLKHPHLHVGLVAEDTARPSWVRLNTINLLDHIEWRTVGKGEDDLGKAFVETSYEQLDTKFGNYQTTPGWKIKVLRQEGSDFIDALLVFNHTIIDGRSARIFHEDLLQVLQDDTQTLEKGLLTDHILELPEDSTARLNPPAEHLVHFPVDATALFYYLSQEVQTPADKYPSRPTQAHWAPIIPTPFKTQFRTITVPRHVLAELTEACRQHKTTLTGLLHALIWVSLTPLLEPSKASAFEFLTAMDLRRFLPAHPPSHPWFDPEKAMANYVTIANHVLDEDLVAQLRSKLSLGSAANTGVAGVQVPSEELMNLVWTVAGKVRRELEAKLDQGLENDMNGFAQAVCDWRAQLSEEACRPRRSSWVITNLGVIDGSNSDCHQQLEASSWAITNAQFIMCANVVASAITVSTVAVKGGDLTVACAWQDCVIDGKVGDAFVADLERWLGFTSGFQDGQAAAEPTP